MNNHLSLMDLKVQSNELLEAVYDKGRQDERLDQNEGKILTDAQINKIKELSRNIGRVEAWTCAKKLVVLPQMGGLSIDDKKKIFGVLDFAPDHVLLTYSPSEAIDKIKEWEDCVINNDTKEDKNENEETNDAAQWISVREKLPEHEGWYECSVKIQPFSDYVMDLYYQNGKWLDKRRIDMYNNYDVYGYGTSNKLHLMHRNEFPEFEFTDYVKAWMPLPETYKGGNAE